jgi:hypothetical protein
MEARRKRGALPSPCFMELLLGVPELSLLGVSRQRRVSRHNRIWRQSLRRDGNRFGGTAIFVPILIGHVHFAGSYSVFVSPACIRVVLDLGVFL